MVKWFIGCIVMILLCSSSAWDYASESKRKQEQDRMELLYQNFISSPKGEFLQQEYMTERISGNRLITFVVWIEAHKYKIDPYLILALIETESKFMVYATGYNKDSDTHDRGLMQLNSFVYDPVVKDYYDIEENIELGVKHLWRTLNEFDGDPVKGLQAYNCGSKRVWRGQVPNSTQAYATKILKRYYEMKNGLKYYIWTKKI